MKVLIVDKKMKSYADPLVDSELWTVGYVGNIPEETRMAMCRPASRGADPQAGRDPQ